MNFEVREIEYSDALFAEMMAEAAAGEAQFLFRLRDQWIDGSERFDRAGELFIGAFSADELVGVAGVSYGPYEPEDGLARVRHVYVLERHRGRGVCRNLMLRLIDHAGKHFTLLRLKTSNPAAASLYETLASFAHRRVGKRIG